jgi:hypothetical protein
MAKLKCVVFSAQAAKFDFAGTKLPPLTQISRRHGMFNREGSPAIGPPGDGNAYIDLDVTFRRVDPQAPAFVQAIIFHNEELENVHRAADTGRFCCTHRNAGSQYGCYVAGEFMMTYQPLYKIDLALPANGSAVTLRGRYDIDKTGLHYLMYSSCQLEAGDVFIDGHNAWMNPYGYLSGELYYNKPFFLGMLIVYSVVLVFWLGLLAKFRDEVLPVQGHICGVIILALLEVLLWYCEYTKFNDDGYRPMPLMVSAIIIGTIKKTVSRLLVLVVCMGYGIVRPNLGSRACQVVLFGIVYCTFSSILDVIKALSHDYDVSGGFFIFVIIPVAVLDSIFYLWTFISLYDVVAQLEERRQTVKLQLYRRFIWVLGICLVFSCVWVLYQMYFLYANLFPTYWEYAWLFDAYWYILSLAILLAIMYLWAPNENSKRYAYYEENVNLDGDDGMELEQQDNSLAPSFSIDGEDGDDMQDSFEETEGKEDLPPPDYATQDQKDPEKGEKDPDLTAMDDI